MVELTCFSFSLDALVGAASLLREDTGAKTLDFSDTFSSVSGQERVKVDVCVTALFLIPLLLIPNMMDKGPELDLQITDTAATTKRPSHSYRPAPAQVTHYIVTPIPPTPPAFWRPHRNLTNLAQDALIPNHNINPRPIVTQFDNIPISQEISRPATSATTRRTTSSTRKTTPTITPLPLRDTTTRSTPLAILAEPLDNEDAETFNSDLWADVPVEPQPDITKVSNVIERQIQNVRERYQDMGVPRKFLTRDMIWKLIRGEAKHSGFHFQ